VAAGIAGGAIAKRSWAAPGGGGAAATSRVGLIKGGDRRRNMRDALAAIEKEIRAGIGDRQVVIKPNFVSTRKQLAATHVEGVMGILDFLKPFYKKPVIIAESPAGGAARRGYENFGYTDLARDYDVSLQELDGSEHRTFWLCDRHLRPAPVRMARMVCDPRYYVISAAVMKTHNAVVATLGLKNLIVGAALKFGRRNDKRQFHHGTKLINYNIALLARQIRPALTTIDGFVGMQGNGPGGGFPMESGVAIASTDVIAADRVGLACMGIDLADVGYLTYCAESGVGEGDLARIDVAGSDLAGCVAKYQLADSIKGQLNWKDEDYQAVSLKGDVRS
jgi:uncharacterized protein (DUF362 family)